MIVTLKSTPYLYYDIKTVRKYMDSIVIVCYYPFNRLMNRLNFSLERAIAICWYKMLCNESSIRERNHETYSTPRISLFPSTIHMKNTSSLDRLWNRIWLQYKGWIGWRIDVGGEWFPALFQPKVRPLDPMCVIFFHRKDNISTKRNICKNKIVYVFPDSPKISNEGEELLFFWMQADDPI